MNCKTAAPWLFHLDRSLSSGAQTRAEPSEIAFFMLDWNNKTFIDKMSTFVQSSHDVFLVHIVETADLVSVQSEQLRKNYNWLSLHGVSIGLALFRGNKMYPEVKYTQKWLIRRIITFNPLERLRFVDFYCSLCFNLHFPHALVTSLRTL